MILAIILVLAALLSLLLLFYFVRGARGAGQNVEDMVALIRPLDLDAFRNLTAADEEKFLRDNLSRREFRMLQRERLRAAADYIAITAHNATVLLRMGEMAAGSTDPHVATEGRNLVDNAARLRIYSVLYLVKLRAAIMLPEASLSLGPLVDNYQRIKGIAAHLTLVQQPKLASRLFSNPTMN